MKLAEYLAAIATSSTASELAELRSMTEGDLDLTVASVERVGAAIGSRFAAIKISVPCLQTTTAKPLADRSKSAHRHTWYMGKCRDCPKLRREFDAEQKQKRLDAQNAKRHAKKGAL